MPNTNIGTKLRKFRNEKNVTLAELADMTNFSIGYLSNLERDLSSPTLDNIQIICQALDISLVKLLQDVSIKNSIIRRDEREVIFEQDNKIRYESINYGSNLLDALCIIVQANSSFDEKWRHNYDEIGLVTEGELTLIIDNEEYILYQGDSFYIRAQTEHSLRNQSDAVCESYWVKQTSDKKVEM